MKTIKIMTKNLKNKPVSIIMIAILFATIMFTVTITSGCCGPGWFCGPGYGPGYYGHDNGYHGGGGYGGGGDNGYHGGGGDHGGGH